MRKMERDMWQWHEEYCGIQRSPVYNEVLAIDAVAKEKELEALGLFFAGLVMLNRFVFALDPYLGTNHEELAQKYAITVLKLGQETESFAAQSRLFTVLKVGVARSVQLTAEEWRVERGCPGAAPLPQSTFARWCGLLGWREDVPGTESRPGNCIKRT